MRTETYIKDGKPEEMQIGTKENPNRDGHWAEFKKQKFIDVGGRRLK